MTDTVPSSEAISLRIIRPGDLPAPPQAAIRVVQACSDPAVTSQQLAQIVTADPVLTAELLRIVNSAFFGMPRGIRTVTHAVTVLGQRALRNLVLCVASRDMLKAGTHTGLDPLEYWEDALRRGVAARTLATPSRLGAEECFTAGLLQDLGLLALFHVIPQPPSVWQQLRSADPEGRYRLEMQHFGQTHEQVGQVLAKTWDLPEELGMAMAGHHDCGGREASVAPPTLCDVCHAADWLAAVFSVPDVNPAIDHCRTLLQRRFGFGQGAMDTFLKAMSGDVEEAATALGLRVRVQPAFEDILRRASARLVEENLSYQELTWRLEQALRERDAYSAQLHGELELAREVQRGLLPARSERTLELTGISVPAREVSGDFYDHFVLPDGRVCFNLADVSGKGFTAALLMAKASALLRCLGKAIHEPARLLAAVNRELCETAVRGMFVTVVAGIYDPAHGLVRIANAGHQPVLYRSLSGSWSDIPAHSPPLGILPEVEFRESQFLLNDGSLYLFTDGLSEAPHTAGGRLELAGIRNMAERMRQLPPADRLQAMLAEVTSSGNPPVDDITLLLLERETAR